jgi:hypothetical protein
MKQAEFLWISCKNVDSLNFHCSSKVDRTQADCTWKDVERYGKQSGVVCSGLLLSFLFTFAPFPVASVVVYWLLLFPLILNLFPFSSLSNAIIPFIPCVALQTSSWTLFHLSELKPTGKTPRHSKLQRRRSKQIETHEDIHASQPTRVLLLPSLSALGRNLLPVRPVPPGLPHWPKAEVLWCCKAGETKEAARTKSANVLQRPRQHTTLAT